MEINRRVVQGDETYLCNADCGGSLKPVSWCPESNKNKVLSLICFRAMLKKQMANKLNQVEVCSGSKFVCPCGLKIWYNMRCSMSALGATKKDQMTGRGIQLHTLGARSVWR